MREDNTPEQSDTYFEDFSAYLRSGNSGYLNRVFPRAKDLAAAAVYRNGFLRACVDALAANYPVVQMLVGEDYFEALALAYIELHPPRKSSFIGYGASFPRYLRNNQEKHKLPYLAAFSRLDRAWMAAYFAEDSHLLDEEKVDQWQRSGNDISEIECGLPKSAELISLDFDVSALWLKLKSGATQDNQIQLNETTEQLLIWRDSHDQINVRVVNAAEFIFLATLLGGNTLIAAASAAIQIQGGFPVIDYFSELLNTDVLASKQIP